MDPKSALPGSKTDLADAETDPAEPDRHLAQSKIYAPGAASERDAKKVDPVTSESDPAVSNNDPTPAETVAADLESDPSRSKCPESRSICNLLPTTCLPVRSITRGESHS